MADIGQFWEDARTAAKLNPLQEYFGPRMWGSITPESYAVGDSPAMADELAALVVEGRKTATASALADYESAGEPLPQRGDLFIIVDGAGEPRALIRTTDVRVVPFSQVDADHAAAEAEGDGSLERWRSGHRDFFERTIGFTEDMPVVLERFELLYPSRWKPLLG